jgi:RHH-type rel operon transcriptional repressor/antitoxin RelB
MPSITIELKESSLMKLENLAKQAGQNTTDYLAQSLDEYLQYLEDSEDIDIAQKRLADLEAGRAKAIPWDEVKRKNGL